MQKSFLTRSAAFAKVKPVLDFRSLSGEIGNAFVLQDIFLNCPLDIISLW